MVGLAYFIKRGPEMREIDKWTVDVGHIQVKLLITKINCLRDKRRNDHNFVNS